MSKAEAKLIRVQSKAHEKVNITLKNLSFLYVTPQIKNQI